MPLKLVERDFCTGDRRKRFRAPVVTLSPLTPIGLPGRRNGMLTLNEPRIVDSTFGRKPKSRRGRGGEFLLHSLGNQRIHLTRNYLDTQGIREILEIRFDRRQ